MEMVFDFVFILMVRRRLWGEHTLNTLPWYPRGAPLQCPLAGWWDWPQCWCICAAEASTDHSVDDEVWVTNPTTASAPLPHISAAHSPWLGLGHFCPAWESPIAVFARVFLFDQTRAVWELPISLKGSSNLLNIGLWVGNFPWDKLFLNISNTLKDLRRGMSTAFWKLWSNVWVLLLRRTCTFPFQFDPVSAGQE